ncbi:MAG: hypothetical protein ACE5HJ_01790 [Thermoplasmata archaeon]
MKTAVSALLALLLLVSPLAAFAAAQEPTEIERDLQVDVSVGSTDRLGGGNWVKIEVGKTIFAVVYGTENNPNNVKMFVEYDRYLGAAEIYSNETGELLVTRPIPVRTIMVQSFDLLVEFRDGDNDGLLHFPRDWRDLLMDTYDYPRKVLSLKQAWTLEGLVIDDSEENVTKVDFNLTATNLGYTDLRPEDDPGDGLDRITLAFHVKVERVLKTGEVNVYKVVVDEDRGIVSTELNRTETLTGLTVNGSFKYDHYIEGWDWGGNDSRLAMATHVLVGNHVPPEVLQWARLQFDPHARAGDDEYHEDAMTERPRLITVDKMEFEDEWTRVGRLRWVSDVEVDGETMEMSFQLHGIERILSFEHNFAGLRFRGAFIYPKGERIFHDPSLDASVFVPVSIESPLGLGPYFIQLGLAGLAVVGLVLYRTLRKKPNPP